jgi:hypothetical protein
MTYDQPIDITKEQLRKLRSKSNLCSTFAYQDDEDIYRIKIWVTKKTQEILNTIEYES